MNCFLRDYMFRTNSPNKVKELITGTPDKNISIRLDEILKYNDMSIAELSRRTGIKENLLGSMILGKTANISIAHLLAIIIALDIKDISDVFEII